MGQKDYFYADERISRAIDGIMSEVHFWSLNVRWPSDERDAVAEFRRQIFLNSWSELCDIGVGLS